MPLDNDDIKQLIAILQKGLVDNRDSENDEDTDTSDVVIKKAKPDPIKNKKKKVVKTDDSRYNKFDAMAEKNMHKDDSRVDKILSQYAPTSRSREFSLVKVTCRVCGRQDEINPALIYDSGSRYKCNRCSKIPG